MDEETCLIVITKQCLTYKISLSLGGQRSRRHNTSRSKKEWPDRGGNSASTSVSFLDRILFKVKSDEVKSKRRKRAEKKQSKRNESESERGKRKE